MNMFEHRRFPRSPINSIFAIVALVLLMTCALQAACNRTQRVDTIRTSLLSVNAARDGFTAWDLEHQQALVSAASTKDAAEQTVSSYRDTRVHIVDGFEVAYRALAVAATQTDELSLTAALTTAAQLVEKIRTMIGGK